uniref:Retrovirus-related Pol polyprotein from transposon TNT 1-94 n=1 Tax=Tanacetum cinerariifolium TaxID=118510 RepID=A0A6L2J9H3_TANCI|nr:retrovirus-related Pol polyprotein from transposon TNT 1-94 [Tanacetum cinerariifolium]
MKSYGEQISDETMVEKIKGEHDYSSQHGRGRARGGYRGRGRGRNNTLKCTICKKVGHSDDFCWLKPEEAKYVEEEEDDDNLLFMTMGTEKQKSDPWYVDSGCSHHMTGDRTKFKGLDEAFKSQVRLGDDKQLQIEGQAPYTPEQNGVAERKNRIVVEMTRCMLKQKGMPDSFWAEGVATTVYILSISPTKDTSPSMSTSTSPSWVGPTSPTSSPTSPIVSSYVTNNNNTVTEVSESVQLCRSERGRVPRRRFQIEGEASSPQEAQVTDDADDTLALFVGDPVHVEDALAEEEWEIAMQDELSAIQKNKTWELVDLPAGKYPIGLKWVFKTKYLADGRIQKHKARLVVKGYAQQHGIDYKKTFSPVARFETIRVILAVVAQQQWKLYQFDVKSAFLNRDLKEEVYVFQPPGFESMSHPNKVFRLRKALYELKQAPCAWYSKIDEFFHKSGFIRSQHEPMLYVKRQGIDLLIFSLYVDDMIYASSSSKLILEFQASMKMFDMTDLGELRYFLGLEIIQTSSGVFMTQQKYVEDTINKFYMAGYKIAPTPMNINEKLRVDDGTCLTNAKTYRSLIGRHDKFVLKGLCDSDWAGSIEDRCITSGYCFLLGTTVVSWKSKKQATVALSSTEAEYVAVTESACQVVWLRRILVDLGQEQVEATTIMCDNISAVMLARNPILHGRTKHIEIKHHYIRELIAKREVRLESCRTNEQAADLLTKALPQILVLPSSWLFHLEVLAFESLACRKKPVTNINTFASNKSENKKLEKCVMMNEQQLSTLVQSASNFPPPKGIKVSYGTAGFRADASILQSTVFRIGILAALRSLKTGGNVIGLMITASHNKVDDNGVKIADPSGGMLSQHWEPFADHIANAQDAQTFLKVINGLTLEPF